MLESCVHVVYENIKKRLKTFFWKYFSVDEKFEISEISKISTKKSENPTFSKNVRLYNFIAQQLIWRKLSASK